MKKPNMKALSVRLPLLFVASMVAIMGVMIPLVYFRFQSRMIDQYTRRAEGVIQQNLHFTIQDTGVGMDESFIPKLFDPFVQEDATTTNRYGGSGLGMAITKNMVDLMGGSIAVESKKGLGTTFNVTIPLQRAQEVEMTETTTPSESSVSVAGLHVLIAEDMEMNAEVLADLLEIKEITSEWAENGKIAVEMLAQSEEHHFDAVLMDMRMPIMDGLTATREIRKLDRTDAKEMPIIALTANAFEEDV
ncbi:MAG: response regulator [Atopobiaceae bacterium]|nr:response regulator [Atopobiaceae bacterium]